MEEKNGFYLFMNEITRIPLLSRDEETALVQKAHMGDIKARDTLVNANIRFVVTVAKEYRFPGLDLEDLVNEGCIGLMTAIEHFDAFKENRLITYASWWIRQSIGRAISEKGRTIRLPQGKAKELDRAFDVLSLDVPVDSRDADNSKTIGDGIVDMRIQTPEYDAIFRNLKEDIVTVFDSLSKREADILRMRFGLDGRKSMTLEEIGDCWNMSRERIRQIESKALRKLKKMFPWLEDYLH